MEISGEKRIFVSLRTVYNLYLNQISNRRYLIKQQLLGRQLRSRLLLLHQKCIRKRTTISRLYLLTPVV